MKTRDFNVFKEMVSVADRENMEYKLLYSYKERNATNGHTEAYTLLLCTTFFKVICSKNFTEEESTEVRNFLINNNGIRLNCTISENADGNIELKAL